jgi:hypothetical protein
MVFSIIDMGLGGLMPMRFLALDLLQIWWNNRSSVEDKSIVAVDDDVQQRESKCQVVSAKIN